VEHILKGDMNNSPFFLKHSMDSLPVDLNCCAFFMSVTLAQEAREEMVKPKSYLSLKSLSRLVSADGASSDSKLSIEIIQAEK